MDQPDSDSSPAGTGSIGSRDPRQGGWLYAAMFVAGFFIALSGILPLGGHLYDGAVRLAGWNLPLLMPGSGAPPIPFAIGVLAFGGMIVVLAVRLGRGHRDARIAAGIPVESSGFRWPDVPLGLLPVWGLSVAIYRLMLGLRSARMLLVLGLLSTSVWAGVSIWNVTGGARIAAAKKAAGRFILPPTDPTFALHPFQPADERFTVLIPGKPFAKFDHLTAGLPQQIGKEYRSEPNAESVFFVIVMRGPGFAADTLETMEADHIEELRPKTRFHQAGPDPATGGKAITLVIQEERDLWSREKRLCVDGAFVWLRAVGSRELIESDVAKRFLDSFRFLDHPDS